MEECVQCSMEFGEKLAREMGVPVYLYEQAQDKEYRKSLTQIRKGNYEGLEEKVWTHSSHVRPFTRQLVAVLSQHFWTFW